MLKIQKLPDLVSRLHCFVKHYLFFLINAALSPSPAVIYIYIHIYFPPLILVVKSCIFFQFCMFSLILSSLTVYFINFWTFVTFLFNTFLLGPSSSSMLPTKSLVDNLYTLGSVSIPDLLM